MTLHPRLDDRMRARGWGAMALGAVAQYNAIDARYYSQRATHHALLAIDQEQQPTCQACGSTDVEILAANWRDVTGEPWSATVQHCRVCGATEEVE